MKICFYDEAGKFITKNNSRYGEGLVLHKRAIFVPGTNAIRFGSPCPILQVFMRKGDSHSIKDAMEKLQDIFGRGPSAKFRAMAALSGASQSGLIDFVEGRWIRVK